MTVALLDPARLLAEAGAAADGLRDFGDASFRPALEVLCRALRQEAKLSTMGAGVLRQKILGQLINRLRVEDHFRRHPEIAQEEIAPPVVIVGLPRTGTTKLQRLLSCDASFWWMAFWESQFPVPFPGESLQQPSARIAEGRKLVDLMTQAMPKLLAIHPMEAEAADEEVMLMEHSFLSAFNAYADIPSYSEWLDRQDQAPAYAYLKRMLQFLQWQKRQRGMTGGQRWLLKSPHHLLRMHALLQAFPGVKVIQTHRDPVNSIPSIASFIHTLWCIYAERAEAAHAGAEWSALMRRALDHTMRVRTEAPAEQFLDVQFEDTVRRPMEVVERVYAFLDLPLDAATHAAMRHWLAQDEKTHQGGHEYTPEEFGLTAEGIRRDFAVYRQKHITGS